ncbi:MAG: ROK family protein [Christensenellales bacterium]
MILSIDIGGTAVKMGLVDEGGEVHARHEASVCFDGYRTPILTTVMREAEAFLRRENAQVAGIGVSATGQVDDRAGVVIGTNGKIPGYEGSRIKEEMESRFHLPVWVLNDANAAALGECFAGAARGRRHVLMLTLGTGVGGGVVLGGELYGGARGIAGELGHFTLYQDGALLPVRQARMSGALCGDDGACPARTGSDGETQLNGRVIFDRAQRGNEVMLGVLSAWIDDIAAGVTGLVHIFNPEMVLIGGGVSAQEELLMKPLRQRVLSGVMPRFAEGLSVERATLGNDAGMIGAARFFMQHS